MLGVGIGTSLRASQQGSGGARPRRVKLLPLAGSACGPMMWWRRKRVSLNLPSRQHGPRESVKMKKWREPFVALKASLRARSRCGRTFENLPPCLAPQQGAVVRYLAKIFFQSIMYLGVLQAGGKEA